ncbi:Alpha-tocopherol transfer protein [Eumeta japonica]|uniref:Alpha-tocopherol transfer protein n=1 Tax=Eumeta variegata TaxID=151549 RepID=A0A4C1UDV1_EUMVA|nr:Alpha-tocopherol transfer protein [Eumeta japonica]
MLPSNRSLVTITEVDKQKIRRFFEVDDEERINNGVATLADWCCRQEHFVEKKINTNILERLFVISKGSVEEAKRRVDSLLTTRGLMGELTLNKTAEEFKCHSELFTYATLPKMHPVDQTRVMVIHFFTDKLDDLSMLAFHRFCILLTEYRHNFDYALAERYILDMKNFSFNLITKLSPMLLRKVEILCTKGYGIKIKGIHILNAPSFVDKVVYILKQGMKEKIGRRIHAHGTLEDLHKHIPKEILPIDYGGEDRSLAELHAKWMEETFSTTMAEYCIAAERLVTDESRRSADKFNEEYMGMPGSFRKLNVD